MTSDLVQVVASVAPADAVTNQCFAWQELLDAHGVRSDIYAEHVHPALTDRVRPLGALGNERTPTLLRYSIWSAAAARARTRRGKLGIVYHNITPAHLIGAANPEVAALCARGRSELPTFARRTTLAVADSRFNAAELMRAGFMGAQVIPLLLDLPHASTTQPDQRRSDVILYVGRVAPSKRVDDAIRVLAYVRRLHAATARLDVIGGSDGFGEYEQALLRLASSLGVRDAVTFLGRVDDATRDRAYESSAVFLTMTEHEGFCVPLVEAMAHGLPVVARASGAVPDTLGRAGLLVQGRDIALAGEAVARVLSDARVRRGLQVNAAHQLRSMDRDETGERILQAVGGLL